MKFLVPLSLAILLNSCALVTTPVKLAGSVATTTVSVAGKAAITGIDAIGGDDDDSEVDE